MDCEKFRVRAMTRAEMDIAVDWAAREGWNPGVSDAQVFYQADKDGFFAAEGDGGKPLGFISAAAYGRDYGFIGFFIVHPDCRGQRVGVELGRAALARLGGRSIGIDGVLDKVRNYAAFGFAYAHKNSRFAGINSARPAVSDDLDIKRADFAEIARYDAECFGFDRRAFLENWINQPGAAAAALRHGGRLRGYAVARKCRTGFKIGPLFADDKIAASALLDAVLAKLPQGERFFWDAPETNAAALALASERGLQIVFSTARMYMGKPPAVPAGRIFGITSFELG